MLHRGLTNPCVFLESRLHAACYLSQSHCFISRSLVHYLPSLIIRLWVRIDVGRLAQSWLLQEILQVFSVLSLAAEALSALCCTRSLMSFGSYMRFIRSSDVNLRQVFPSPLTSLPPAWRGVRARTLLLQAATALSSCCRLFSASARPCRAG